MTKKTCPHCGAEVNIIPFGSRFIAVCCNQVIYVGNEPPRQGKPDTSGSNSGARQDH